MHGDTGVDQGPGPAPAWSSAATRTTRWSINSTASSPSHSRIATGTRSRGSPRTSSAVCRSATVLEPHQLAVVDHTDSVTLLLHLSRAGDWTAARSGPAPRGPAAASRIGASGWVQAVGRLVEDEHVRAARASPRDAQALLHAVEYVRNRSARPRRATRPGASVDATSVAETAVAGQHAQVLPAGQVREEARPLDERPDPGGTGPPARRRGRGGAGRSGGRGPGASAASWSCRRRSGPRKPYISPRRTVRLTWSTAVAVAEAFGQSVGLDGWSRS